MKKLAQCRFSVLSAALTVACWAPGGSLLAQTTTGTIVGTVTDASGSVLPNAVITVVDQQTGAERRTTTTHSGDYTASLLSVGNYNVVATANGFQTQSVSGIVLEVNQTVRRDFKLQLGSTTQNVNVTAAAPLIKTDTSDVGQVIDSTQETELPLNGRNLLQLATLTTGTLPVSEPSGHAADSVMAEFGGGVMTNGADSNGNQMTLDGVENQDYLLPRPGVLVNPDAMAEFKIMTGDYSASYGRAAGANINLVTKSGTNNFHGDAWEFVRNNDLNARNFFQTGPNAPFKQNQFGFTFGGPIVKDKTFFFGSFEGFRQNQGLTIAAIMPTAAERQGNFAGEPTIYDPLTTVETSPGVYSRTAFPGNVVPSNRISPQATNALNLLYPMAQTQAPEVINSVFNPTQLNPYDQYVARVDHTLTSKDRIFGRYARWKNPGVLPTFVGGSGVPGSSDALTDSDVNAVLGWTRIISPSMVNEARLGFNRFVENSLPANRTNYLGEIGITGALDFPQVYGAPLVSISGITSVGPSPYAPSLTYTNSLEYIDTLSVVKSSHHLEFGADIRRAQLNGTQYPFPRGSYGFDTSFTDQPYSPTGNGLGMADFLLGDVTSSYLIDGRTDVDLRDLNAGFFAQDDWNATRSLTLNLGLRYEDIPQPVSAANRFANWDQAADAIIVSQNNLNNVPPCAGCNGATVAQLISQWTGIFNIEPRSAVGWPKALVQSHYANFAPRVGAAWRVFGSDKTVLRGGFGKFYEVVAGNLEWNFSDQPPYSRTLSFTSNSLAPSSTWLNFAAPFPSTTVTGAPGSGVMLYNYDNPFTYNWNVSLQRDLTRGTTLSVGYVGLRAYHQLMPVDYNSPEFGNPSANVQTLRPNPSHGSTQEEATWGHTWFDSLQVVLQTRLHGVQILTNYTWENDLTEGGGGVNQVQTGGYYVWNHFGFRTPVLSGNLSTSDPYLAAGKGPAAGDVHQIFNTSYVWDLPFGQGRRFRLSGFANQIAGGWELTGITTAQTGYHLPVSSTIAPYPNLIGNPNSGAPHSVGEFFNTAAFAQPLTTLDVYQNNLNPALALGNAGRAPVVGPGLYNWDIGLFKNFPITERFRLQFRSEFFNAFNHANFGDPNTTLGTGTFGVLSSAAPGREIQFALKLYF